MQSARIGDMRGKTQGRRALIPLAACAWIAAAFLGAAGAARAADAVFTPPADDQWQYPFNGGSVADDPEASCFAGPSSGPYAGQFNYRDGMLILRFDTTAAATPGQGEENYDFTGAQLVLYHPAGTYTWDTRSGVNAYGDPHQIQVFGVGVDESAQSSFTKTTWTEASPIYAKTPFNLTQVRTPHPLNIDDSATTQNMTDQTGVTPWGLGAPVYGSAANAGEYEPGANTLNPFPVTFTINTGNTRVKNYIREGLNTGKLDWIVCALFEGSQSGGDFYPRFLTSEGAGAGQAPTLTLLNFTQSSPVPDWIYY